MVAIRKAEYSDVEILREMEEELFHPPYQKTDLEYFIGENSFTRALILQDEKEVVGFGLLWLLFEQAEIVQIGIRKKYQSQGYGKKLLEYMLALARRAGCENVTLEVRVSNNKARDFYHKFGFIQLATRANYYQQPAEDALLLGRGLL